VSRENEILSIREKLAKIRLAENDSSSSFSAPKIPLVKTFEGDLMDQMNNGSVSKLSIIKGEMDNGVSVLSVADKSKKNKKIILIILGLLFVLGASVGGYFYYEYVNRPIPVVTEVKRYYIVDVWKSVAKDVVLKDSTSDATSTEDVIVVDVLNFEKLYPYMLKNENKFEGLVKDKFRYSNLGEFQDATIENIDMRVADCNEGAIVYGYVDKSKLIISNDIGKYLKTYKDLKK
jgi:hypothetical protein